MSEEQENIGFTLPQKAPEGLLISMALRMDHSFGMPSHSLAHAPGFFNRSAEDIEKSRNKMLEMVSRTYDVFLALCEKTENDDYSPPSRLRPSFVKEIMAMWKNEGMYCDAADVNRMFEEMTGKGFWSPTRNENYVSMMKA